MPTSDLQVLAKLSLLHARSERLEKAVAHLIERVAGVEDQTAAKPRSARPRRYAYGDPPLSSSCIDADFDRR